MQREDSRTGTMRRSKEALSSTPSSTKVKGSTANRVRRQGPAILRKSDLSPDRRWLLEKMQRLGFGRIKHLVIANGEPLRSPPPRIYRQRRFNGPNASRPEVELGDFIVKRQVLGFFEELDCLGNTVIATLEVRDGLPFSIALEESDRA